MSQTGREGEMADGIGIPDGLTVRLERKGGRAALILAGELDLASAETLSDKLRAVEAERPPVIALDLRRVGFLDSSGLALAARAHTRARREGPTVRDHPGSSSRPEGLRHHRARQGVGVRRRPPAEQRRVEPEGACLVIRCPSASPLTSSWSWERSRTAGASVARARWLQDGALPTAHPACLSVATGPVRCDGVRRAEVEVIGLVGPHRIEGLPSVLHDLGERNTGAPGGLSGSVQLDDDDRCRNSCNCSQA